MLRESHLSAASLPWEPVSPDPVSSSMERRVAEVVDTPSSSETSSETESDSTGPEADAGTTVGFMLSTVREAQAADVNIGAVLEYFKRGRPPSQSELWLMADEAKQIVHGWRELMLRDGVLYRSIQRKVGSTIYQQIVLPQKLR